ncbi:platelet-derived growth factor beta polypeptide a isoform X2 [Phyllopteryx taeniolatus]|uniref:platelet-derived growth factor beta polypeptide a isoform X2 n=1 Tax=Phyllopteryx taeniolatus TaxID=161469 RepID=UPI002AD4CC4D|nr:platelet-derived growth factor beta polypeptide a isoform X2 [Phyllopteryx taeniolatus]
MRSWLLLLLLLLLRLGGAEVRADEGDPLPASLVDLVRNSPVSSVDDLKLLLQHEADAIEEDDDHGILTNQTHGRHIRSIAEAEIAQQAACRVRTEVMEVTRAMLDRRNANFMLWPPCVEVQRCSGCCNTRLLQCVPAVTSSRYLQVIKIQYINRKAHYEKAIISVEDHLACRCQPSSPNPAPLTPPSHPHPPLPRAAHPAPPMPRGSKADLHRNDDLKRNQRFYNSEEQEPAARRWPQGGYTQLVRWTQPRPQQSADGWPSDARADRGVTGNPPQVGPGSGHEGSREEGGQVRRRQFPSRSYERGESEDRNLRTQYRLNAPQSDGASLPEPTPSPQSQQSPTPVLRISTNHKDSVSGRPNIEATPTHPRTQAERQTGSGRRHSESADQGVAKDLTPANSGGQLTEEERRQKVLEVVQGELDRPTHLHPQQRPELGLATAAPPPSSRQTPFRPASPRRRRKHRKRISKEAMRAMIM